jgi:hypothetical protein
MAVDAPKIWFAQAVPLLTKFTGWVLLRPAQLTTVGIAAFGAAAFGTVAFGSQAHPTGGPAWGAPAKQTLPDLESFALAGEVSFFSGVLLRPVGFLSARLA